MNHRDEQQYLFSQEVRHSRKMFFCMYNTLLAHAMDLEGVMRDSHCSGGK